MRTIGKWLFDGSWLGLWDKRQQHREATGQWRGITLLLCLMALLLGVQNPLLYGMTPAFDSAGESQGAGALQSQPGLQLHRQ